MPLYGKRFAFTKANVDLSPDEPGVYELLRNGSVIYIGRAKVSIRQRLQRHQRGDEGMCTMLADEYRREPCTDPVSREVKLLEEFKRIHGRLPSCNERVG